MYLHRPGKIHLLLPVILAAAWAVAAVAASPPLPAFTAHYELLRSGASIGKATLTLTPGDHGTWKYTTTSAGTSGLAALLGASVDEVSVFRWVGGLPQGISYDYTLHTALNTKQRRVRFDWTQHTIEVTENGTYRFPTQPGAMERHTVPLAIAAGLAAGKSQFTLPVAVRNRIEMQHYAAQGQQKITVPAGTFVATRVVRTDGGGNFAAWFVPGKLPTPVKVAQTGKNKFSLELQSWSKP